MAGAARAEVAAAARVAQERAIQLGLHQPLPMDTGASSAMQLTAKSVDRAVRTEEAAEVAADAATPLMLALAAQVAQVRATSSSLLARSSRTAVTRTAASKHAEETEAQERLAATPAEEEEEEEAWS